MEEIKERGRGAFGELIEEYNFYFYKGVMHFYCQDYASAIDNFTKSLSLIE